MKKFAIIPIVLSLLSYPLNLVKAQAGGEKMLEFYYSQAAQAYYEGDYDKAILYWKRVLQIDPNQKQPKVLIEQAGRKKIQTRYEKADEFYQKGDYAQAINIWREILELDPNETKAGELIAKARQVVIDSYYKKGDEFFAREDYKNAIAQWEEILKLDPEQKRAGELIERTYIKLLKKQVFDFCQRAESFYSKGFYRSAYETYQEAAKLDPADVTETRVKDYLRKLYKIVEITPEETGNDKVSALVRKGLANYLSRDGNPRISISALRYAEQLESANAKIKMLRQFVEEEYLDIARLETFSPGISVIEQKLLSALNCIYDGKYDSAIIECEIALELDPSNAVAYKRLGSAYYALGKKEKAKEIWAKALEIYPDDAELKQSLKK